MCRLYQYLAAWDDVLDLQTQTTASSQKMENSLGISSQHLQIQTHTNSDIAPLSFGAHEMCKHKFTATQHFDLPPFPLYPHKLR